jgi:hypothetical protein
MERDINAGIRPEPSFAAPRKMLLVRPIRFSQIMLCHSDTLSEQAQSDHDLLYAASPTQLLSL